MKKSMLKFSKNNLISCENVPFGKVMFEYLCWKLGGKPDNYKCNLRKFKWQ